MARKMKRRRGKNPSKSSNSNILNGFLVDFSRPGRYLLGGGDLLLLQVPQLLAQRDVVNVRVDQPFHAGVEAVHVGPALGADLFDRGRIGHLLSVPEDVDQERLYRRDGFRIQGAVLGGLGGVAQNDGLQLAGSSSSRLSRSAVALPRRSYMRQATL